MFSHRVEEIVGVVFLGVCEYLIIENNFLDVGYFKGLFSDLLVVRQLLFVIGVA